MIKSLFDHYTKLVTQKRSPSLGLPELSKDGSIPLIVVSDILFMASIIQPDRINIRTLLGKLFKVF